MPQSWPSIGHGGSSHVNVAPFEISVYYLCLRQQVDRVELRSHNTLSQFLGHGSNHQCHSPFRILPLADSHPGMFVMPLLLSILLPVFLLLLLDW